MGIAQLTIVKHDQKIFTIQLLLSFFERKGDYQGARHVSPLALNALSPPVRGCNFLAFVLTLSEF